MTFETALGCCKTVNKIAMRRKGSKFSFHIDKTGNVLSMYTRYDDQPGVRYKSSIKIEDILADDWEVYYF